MSDRIGPHVLLVSARTMRTCIGCVYYNQRLVKSGRDPEYRMWCSHPDAAESDRCTGGDLQTDETPDWCPAMKRTT